MSESIPPPTPEPRLFHRPLATVRNVAACYAGTAAEGAVFLLITPFLVRRLGLVSFGLWSLAIALVEWLQLLDLGLRDALMKYTAAHQARAEAEGVRRLAGSALFVYLLLGLLALVLVQAFAWTVLPGLVEDPDYLYQARGAFLLLGLSAAIALPGGVAGSLLEGLSRFDLLNLFRTMFAFVRLALIVLAIQFQFDLIGLAAAELVSRLILHAVRWTAVIRLYPAIVPKPKPSKRDLRRLFGFGLWAALRQGSETAANRICEPILAVFTGAASVGTFAIGRRVATMSAEVIVPLAGVLFPLSSELEASGRGRSLRQTLIKTTKFAFFTGVPISLVLGLGAGPIQRNWLGGKAPEVEPILTIFSAVFLVVAVSLPSEVILQGLGRVRLLAMLGGGQVAIIAGLGVFLTRRIGAEGLALATLVAAALLQAILIPIAARRCRLPLSILLGRAVLPAVVAGAPVALGMLLLREDVAGGGLASLATWAVGGGLTYSLIYWWIGLDGEERTFFKSHAARLWTPVSEVDDWDER
jgi:O-antigen/teichoic acid export membrane protein